MDLKPHNGGREYELNKISTPAVPSARPIFFRQAKIESQEPLAEWTEVRASNWQQQSDKFFRQILSPSDI